MSRAHVVAIITSTALLALPLAVLAQSENQPPPSGYCHQLSQTLTRGMRDATLPPGQVTELQKFLSDYYDLNPADYITGYFGRKTRDNVRKFQCEQGLACSGTEATTGWGLVGPRTRAAIAQSCDHSTYTPPTDQYEYCAFNGHTLRHGQSVTAYQTASVPAGQSCLSEARICQNGTLSGTYQYSSCTEQQANAPTCTPLSAQTQTPSCPAGQTGSITQRRTSSCAGSSSSPAWSPWTETKNSCAPETPDQPFGFYYWGGYDSSRTTGDILQPGVQPLLGNGVASAIRLVIAPLHAFDARNNVYKINFDPSSGMGACIGSKAYLPCAIRSVEYQQVFSLPQLRTIVLTAYDSASTGKSGQDISLTQLDRMRDPAKQAEVVEEYRDAVLAIYETQHDSRKTFIISNWEADNEVYGACGGIEKIAENPATATCDVASRFEAMKLWLSLRQRGVALGKEDAARAGLSGVSVEYAIQFNAPNFAKKAGHSVLHDIIPLLKPEWADYSAWESSNLGHMDEDLAMVRATIPAGTKLMLGELDTASRLHYDENGTWRWLETIKAALRGGVDKIILWEAYDDKLSGLNDGLFNSDGTPRSWIGRLNTMLATPQASGNGLTIDWMYDIAWHPGDSTYPAGRYLELHGNLPGTGYTATAICDGKDWPLHVWDGGTPIQKNISLDDLMVPQGADNARWCTFTLRNAQGQSSNSFGPRRFCANSTCH